MVLREDTETLDEVVVVGYGAKKNKKSTTLGSVVKVEEQAEKEQKSSQKRRHDRDVR